MLINEEFYALDDLWDEIICIFVAKVIVARLSSALNSPNVQFNYC